MHSSQLDILPPEQAALLIRKKRFWKKTMWIASISTILIPVIGITCCNIGIVSPKDTLEWIDTSLITIVTTLSLTALAFLLSLVSFIRFLSLPKTPAMERGL